MPGGFGGLGFARVEMREIGLGKGGACLYRDNEERMDPDRDFSHIDKRIQDVLGQYQKDFMGEVSADNLGARWGGYGSFLPVTRCSSVPTITRPQTNISSRSPHNSTKEVHQNVTFQANESIHVRPRPGIPPLSGQSTSALDNAADVRSSGDALIKNQPKAIPPDLSDNNVSKLISDNAVDNSAIYSGLGLDMSPSSSFEESPLNIDGTPPRSQRLPDKSSSHIIKVMTSLPVPGGKLLSPLSERFVFLANKEIKQDRILPRVENSMQIEHELFSSEGKMTVLNERKVKQNNRSKVSEFEGKNCEDPPSITGHPSKRMEDSKMSKGKEINTENPVDTNFMHRDKKGTSTCMEKDDISRSSYAFSKRNGVAQLVDAVPKSQKQSYVKEEPLPEQVDSPTSPVSTDFIRLDKKSSSTLMEKDNISRASYPLSKRNGVAKLVDYGAKYQKQSHVKEETPSEHVDSLASLVSPFEEKEIPAGFSGKIQRDMNVTSVIKSDIGNDNVSQKGHGSQNSKKSREPQSKVKEELPEPFSSQDVGLQHVMLVRDDTDKSRKQQRKMKNEAIVLPDSTLQNAGASLDRTTDISMEKFHNDRKPSSIASIMEKDLNDKKQLRNEEFDNSLGRNYLDGAKAEPLEECSSAKNLSQSQMRANLKGKERLSSESKKKMRKSQEGIQASVVLPKVSFKVGSSAAFSQQTDCGSDELRKVKDRSSDVTSNATPKKKEKVTATKDPIIGVAKREKHALGSQQKDKPDSSQYQCPSSTGLVPRADPIDNAYSMEKAPTSGAVPTETAPVVIQEDWVQCDKCQTWRLLPHNIKPDDLPKRWLCSMLNWLPGMNKCSFTEDQTRDALRALYQLPPAVNNAQIPQTYPNRGPPVVVATDKQPVGMTMPVTGIDPLPETVKRVAKQEVQVESKMDQLRTVESGKKQKPIQSRSGPSKQVVVIGKKREGSKDAHGALKKVKRESQQYDKDQNCIVPLTMETGNAILNDDSSTSQVHKDPVMDKPNNYSKKLKEKSQRTVTKEDERKDISSRKRKSRDSSNGPVATEIPSSEVPFKERGDDPRREKRQKLEPNLQEKESSTTRPNYKNDVGDQDNVSCGGSSQKSGRREDRPYRNTTKTADGRKLSRSDPELKMPALAAATSSSSKISSTCRVKVKSQAKCSPVGSISSSPMRVSRSNHDRSRDQFSTPNVKQEFSTTKNKNLEARTVVPNMAHHYEERTERKSEKGTDAGVQFHPVQEDGAVKQIGIKFNEEGDSSHRKSVNFKGLDKTISDNLLPERFRPKQDQAGSSRDHPSSSTQVLDFGKIVGFNAMASHDDSKGKPPSQQGCGKLIADDVRPSSSVRKDNIDRAARTALREAKDLKHSANRLKINGSGLSTEVFFQAALKFLNGASLLEFDNAEGSGSSDMKPSEVYRSTAKLCIYCAREFEKLNDMASAALAYKCMEVAYMRVVYYSDVVASRDRHELQLAQTEAPQVESPSSSASDVDNVNNPTPNGVVVRATQTSAVHGNYVISADNRPSFDRLLNFAEDVNLAMDAARKSQNAFAVARSTLRESGNEDSITAIKRVLDFSFHDVDELLYLVRLAMEAIPNR
ncbi:hypothetical protein V2J09_007875 [Rumex salicifolius]